MPKSMRHPMLLAVIAAFVFFTNLGAAHLWDVDEAIFAAAAKEMLARGDHMVPYFNGEVFTHKPAMMYWFMIAAYEMFGPTEFAARFWSAVFGIGSVLLTYRLGWLMFSPTVGFLSGLVLASSLNFNLIARAATPDSFLVFFSTLAVLVFVSGTGRAKAPSANTNEREPNELSANACEAPWAGQTRFEPSWATYTLTYAAMGCGVLTKGPIGVLLPTAVIGLFLLIVRAQPLEQARSTGWGGSLINTVRWAVGLFAIKHFLRTVWSMRPLTAIGMVLAVAAPWYVLVGIKTDGEWLIGFFGVHNFGRFFGAMENHRGPIFYYLVAIAAGFFPWSVLLGPSWSHMKRRLAAEDPWRPGFVLVGCWFAVWVGFFSLAGTKLPSYVVPAYPALALFTGALVDGWLRDPSTVSRTWNRLIWGTVALSGLGMLVAFPIVAHRFLEDDWILGAVGLIPLASAGVGLFFSERDAARGAVATLSVLGIVLAIGLFSFGAVRVDRFQASAPFGKWIAEHTPADQQPAIGSFHYFRPSLVFYTGRPIDEFDTADKVRSFFAAHPQSAFVFTTDESFDKLDSALPPDVSVLNAHPRFLHSGNVLLLGRTQQGSSTAKSAERPVSARQ
jgi:4-amino-4-deoxy-L-arabinose transferase-like glycosyltransferase